MTPEEQERLDAAAKGEPYAVPLDFPVRWDVGAPMPHLFRIDTQALLTFYIDTPDPNWDGTYTTVVDPSSGQPAHLALITFDGCESAKLGAPNEDVHYYHVTGGRGMEPYTAQFVENSPWLAELIAMNRRYAYFDVKRWSALRHYVFWFHDSTFECIAASYEVEVFYEPMRMLLARVCERLLSG